MKKILFSIHNLNQCLLITFASMCSIFSYAEAPANHFTWPNGSKLAVSLSYDDALNSQLDNVIPALDKRNLKASFYVVINSPVLLQRKAEWQAAVLNGHELGNHSVNHPCSASLPNREWVQQAHNLDRYTVKQMVMELEQANAFLTTLDGKTERTYTVPCGDLLIEGQPYLDNVRHLFVAIKGHGLDPRFTPILYPAGETGKQLIEYIQQQSSDTLLVNIIFHGVGGDYLSVTAQAHEELVDFLALNSHIYYVDNYINLMKYAAQH
ncbi:polysaccharide deacetylase family protein [Shewanella holmiensis]|uniref:Polysaccharide deacetylase family protein n=1 Tax=Shewanella holmiensis TaxID=2952222 RepID=A0A9X3APS5_9GAMM|nr:polysaccharide deacetylase family protein [Shewanella holmiensis]MCT7942331.1 polysaccharide deacetylase family protein [Shewanella holmiensis]